MKKLCAIVIILVYFVTAFCIPAAAVGGNPDMPLRIGLRYAGNGDVSYNIFYENGFHYGYTSSDAAAFTSVYNDAGRFIAVCKNSNLYYNGSSVNDMQDGTCIGAYHVQIERSFASKEEADVFLSGLKSAGIPDPFVAYTGRDLKIRFGAYQTSAQAQSAVIEEATGYPATAVGENLSTFTVVDLNSGKIIFEFDDINGSGFTVRAKQTGNGRPALKNGSNYYYGDFEFKMNAEYHNITFVNIIDLQTYVKCVVPYEMTSTWPIEALKAQAVAARSYAVANLDKHSKYGFSLCASSDCQVYYGKGRMSDQSDRAVDETYGMIATYNGAAVTLFYHSSSGGYTEPTENVWVTNTPYLKSVTTPYEDLENAINGLWNYEVTKSELTSYFQSKGYDISKIRDIYVDQYTPSGNVYRVIAVNENGKQLIFEKDNIRIRLSNYVKSLCFTVSAKFNMAINDQNISFAPNSASIITAGEDKTTAVGKAPPILSDITVLTAEGNKKMTRPEDFTFVIDGRGWGNNVGMSQQSAKGMAENGYTYTQILSHFFPGTVLEIMN